VLGYYPQGSIVVGKDDAAMKINTISNIDGDSIEEPNVRMDNMSNETIQKNYDIILEDGIYVVVRSLRPLTKGEPLMVKDYGSNSKMPFGKDAFLEKQKECFRVFEEKKSKAPLGLSLCPKCFQILPRSKDKRKEHNLRSNKNCIPYIDTIDDFSYDEDDDNSDLENELNTELSDSIALNEDE
jgi:hypothetical protein